MKNINKNKNCICSYCGKRLPGFVECNCPKKDQNKNLWGRKIGRRGKCMGEK
jgi:hypothetical protein